MYTLCLLVIGSRQIGQKVLNSDVPQSLQVCNETTLVKIIAIPCKSWRGEKHNVSMSSVQLTRCPHPKANSFAFVKQIGQTYISKLGRK